MVKPTEVFAWSPGTEKRLKTIEMQLKSGF